MPVWPVWTALGDSPSSDPHQLGDPEKMAPPSWICLPGCTAALTVSPWRDLWEVSGVTDVKHRAPWLTHDRCWTIISPFSSKEWVWGGELCFGNRILKEKPREAPQWSKVPAGPNSHSPVVCSRTSPHLCDWPPIQWASVLPFLFSLNQAMPAKMHLVTQNAIITTHPAGTSTCLLTCAHKY